MYLYVLKTSTQPFLRAVAPVRVMNVNQRLMNEWRSSFHLFSLPFLYFIFINLIIGVLFRLLLVAQLPR